MTSYGSLVLTTILTSAVGHWLSPSSSVAQEPRQGLFWGIPETQTSSRKPSQLPRGWQDCAGPGLASQGPSGLGTLARGLELGVRAHVSVQPMCFCVYFVYPLPADMSSPNAAFACVCVCVCESRLCTVSSCAWMRVFTSVLLSLSPPRVDALVHTCLVECVPVC